MKKQGSLFDGGGAFFSPCRTWRYVLWRVWDSRKARCVFIGLNPSTADETEDDPTIRRCVGFARRWGFGGIVMLNIFAFRATDPRDLKKAEDPVGPQNDEILWRYHDLKGLTVACWGSHGDFMRRGKKVAKLLVGMRCFGLTAAGHPKHPLYLRADSETVPFLGGAR